MALISEEALAKPLAVPDVDTWVKQAGILIDQGRPKDGQTYAEKALAAAPDDHRPYAMMAMARAHQGDKNAHEWAERAVARAPTSAAVHAILGSVYRIEKEFPKAERALARALELDPGDPDTLNDYAVVLMGMERFPPAKAALERAIRLNPQDVNAHHNLSVVLENMGDRAASERELEIALRLKPDDPQTQYVLGQARMRRGDDPGAAAAFRESLRLDPTNRPAKHGLVTVLAKNHPLLGPFCRWSSTLARAPAKYRILVALIPYFVFHIAKGTLKASDAGATWLFLLAGAYLLFIVYMLTAGRLVDLFLRKGWLDV